MSGRPSSTPAWRSRWVRPRLSSRPSAQQLDLDLLAGGDLLAVGWHDGEGVGAEHRGEDVGALALAGEVGAPALVGLLEAAAEVVGLAGLLAVSGGEARSGAAGEGVEAGQGAKGRAGEEVEGHHRRDRVAGEAEDERRPAALARQDAKPGRAARAHRHPPEALLHAERRERPLDVVVTADGDATRDDEDVHLPNCIKFSL